MSSWFEVGEAVPFCWLGEAECVRESALCGGSAVVLCG